VDELFPLAIVDTCVVQGGVFQGVKIDYQVAVVYPIQLKNRFRYFS
jgi:hypothetical protein